QMNVAQVQSEYETAAAQIPQIESQIAQTENALSILLGRNPGSIARGKSIAELMLPSVPSGIPSQLLERRPDLMQSEQQLIDANALVASQKRQEQVAAQGRLVAALKDYARLATLQYNNGYTSYTTVLQAEQSLFPAELTLASVRAQVFSSSVNIYKAMGGGWVAIADKATTSGAATVPLTDVLQQPPPLF